MGRRRHCWSGLLLGGVIACEQPNRADLRLEPPDGGRETGAAEAADGGAGAVEAAPEVTPAAEVAPEAPIDLPPDTVEVAEAGPEVGGDAIGGASRCPAGVLLCDGFERPAVTPGAWLPFAEAGSALSIDGGRAARGTSALRLHVDARASTAVGIHWTSPGALPSVLYVRFFLLLPQPTPVFAGAFAGIDDDGGAQEQSVSVDWSSVDLSLGGTGGVLASDPERAPLPGGRWHCLVMRLETGAAGTFSLYLDDGASPALASPLNKAPAWKRVMFAISADGAQTEGVDLWIDEILVAATPLGCTN